MCLRNGKWNLLLRKGDNDAAIIGESTIPPMMGESLSLLREGASHSRAVAHTISRMAPSLFPSFNGNSCCPNLSGALEHAGEKHAEHHGEALFDLLIDQI